VLRGRAVEPLTEVVEEVIAQVEARLRQKVLEKPLLAIRWRVT
jgi:hypothetical protein